MKVFCKQSYIIHSDGTELYTKGLWYDVRHIEMFQQKIVAYAIANNIPNIFDEYYFVVDGYNDKFEDYFYTMKEIRKMKLKKINNR